MACSHGNALKGVREKQGWQHPFAGDSHRDMSYFSRVTVSVYMNNMLIRLYTCKVYKRFSEERGCISGLVYKRVGKIFQICIIGF